MAAPPLLRLVHPFPSALNALVVLGIALVAGGSVVNASLLALAMLGLQFCIGAVNDLYDERLDAQSKPHKPIPAGLVTRRAAWMAAAISGVAGVALAFAVRAADPVLLAMAVAMLGAGLAYDAWLKPTPLSWLPFSVALPILPLYAWYGATGALPPRWEVLVPVAALAGPYLQLANGLIDLETDRAAGLQTFPGVLGRRRALAVMAAAAVVIHGLAAMTLPASVPVTVPALAGMAGGLGLGGLVASAQRERLLREIGWMAQAGSVAVLAVGWLLGAVSVP